MSSSSVPSDLSRCSAFLAQMLETHYGIPVFAIGFDGTLAVVRHWYRDAEAGYTEDQLWKRAKNNAEVWKEVGLSAEDKRRESLDLIQCVGMIAIFLDEYYDFPTADLPPEEIVGLVRLVYSAIGAGCSHDKVVAGLQAAAEGLHRDRTLAT